MKVQERFVHLRCQLDRMVNKHGTKNLRIFYHDWRLAFGEELWKLLMRSSKSATASSNKSMKAMKTIRSANQAMASSMKVKKAMKSRKKA